MSRRPAERRPSYGRHSPTVGERGERTRASIVGSTLRLLDERGFHGTLVDDIATDAGVSRATLYQYFESKDSIFLELAEESGAALIRVLKRLGPLTPTREGFDELLRWVTEWTDVFDRYATIFIQWSNVNSPEAELSRRLGKFLDSHTSRLARHLAQCGATGIDPDATAVLFLSLLERGHYLRSLHWNRERPTSAFTGSLAIAFQLYLFPHTPPDALPAAPAPSTRRRRKRNGPSTAAPAARFTGLTPQGRRTVARLLDAGADVLAANGYATTTVDQIVVGAGVARGTFYKYFDDRLDLVRALAEECSSELDVLDEAFARIAPADLRSWLERFLAFRRRYSGVLRVWTERFPDDPAVASMAERTAANTSAAYVQCCDRLGGAPVLHRASGALMLMAMLEHFPGRSRGTAHELADGQVVDAQLRLLTTSLLGRLPVG